jgi:hypothetical protein
MTEFLDVQFRRLLLGLALLWGAGGLVSAADKQPLRVLYVGDVPSPRAADYREFLQARFARVETVSRRGFQPAQAQDFDVVLLDWPQGSEGSDRPKTTPLGRREDWAKPTVLLGSAGLLTSMAWDIKGGHG